MIIFPKLQWSVHFYSIFGVPIKCLQSLKHWNQNAHGHRSSWQFVSKRLRAGQQVGGLSCAGWWCEVVGEAAHCGHIPAHDGLTTAALHWLLLCHSVCRLGNCFTWFFSSFCTQTSRVGLRIFHTAWEGTPLGMGSMEGTLFWAWAPWTSGNLSFSLRTEADHVHLSVSHFSLLKSRCRESHTLIYNFLKSFFVECITFRLVPGRGKGGGSGVRCNEWNGPRIGGKFH